MYNNVLNPAPMALSNKERNLRSVLVVLTLAVAAILWSAYSLYQQVPQPVANSVIAEKSSLNGGNQVATVLPSNLSSKQHRLLNLAYSVAKENGFRNPEIVQAVLLQETLAGGLNSYRVANPGPEAYFGVGQIKLAAARDVLARWPELYKKYDFHTRTDDEVRAYLILNEQFNIEVMTKYILLLKTQYGFSGMQLLQAYNRGPGGVTDDTTYANSAFRKLTSLKSQR